MKRPEIKILLTLSLSTAQNFAHEIYHIFLGEIEEENLQPLYYFVFQYNY
jgi:hypothetical protein